MPRYIDADKLKEQDFQDFSDNDVMIAIDSTPTAHVAPVVHGRWKHLGGDEFCCTNCVFVVTTEGSWENPHFKHCPNCGAKMKDGESE